jgi:hypothetical protein
LVKIWGQTPKIDFYADVIENLVGMPKGHPFETSCANNNQITGEWIGYGEE